MILNLFSIARPLRNFICFKSPDFKKWIGRNTSPFKNFPCCRARRARAPLEIYWPPPPLRTTAQEAKAACLCQCCKFNNHSKSCFERSMRWLKLLHDRVARLLDNRSRFCSQCSVLCVRHFFATVSNRMQWVNTNTEFQIIPSRRILKRRSRRGSCFSERVTKQNQQLPPESSQTLYRRETQAHASSCPQKPNMHHSTWLTDHTMQTD